MYLRFRCTFVPFLLLWVSVRAILLFLKPLSLSLSLCFAPASRHWMLPTLAISISNLRMEIYIINIIGLLKIMLVKFILWNRLSSTVIFFLDKCLIKFSFLCIYSWKLVLLFINKAQVLLKLPFEKWEQWTRKMWKSS